ncbi:MAG: hypothetical protein ACP5H8_02185 [Candidatus Micrarchaeia archaeon]
MKEPLAIGYFDEKKSPRKILCEIVLGSTRTVPALVGEIFNEKERGISAVYEGILRVVANENVVSGGSRKDNLRT